MTEFLTRQHIIFVDDDDALRAATTQSLELADIDVRAFADAETALAEIDARFVGAIVTDIRMPRLDGLEFFARIRAIDPDIPVILITGHADVPMAIGALQSGAFDFLAKPYATEHLVASVRKALETRRLVLDNRMLRAAAESSVDSPLIGDSPVMAQVRATIQQISLADIDVLVEGETGTGKELAALLLHRKGPRSGRPFITVDCGALPEQLAEFELFGHDRGAVGYGALAREGRIEQANRGTLFLDGIDNMPLAIQSMLLRVVEERKVQPIGASEPRAVDLRIVASARDDLQQAVAAGSFREDLFYRLNVVPIRVPPVRERAEDIPDLVRHFFALAEKEGLPRKSIDGAAMDRLKTYRWPGNVRELLNVLRRSTLFAERDELDGELVRRMIAASVFAHGATAPAFPASVPAPPESSPASGATSLADMERTHIERVLQEMGGNITRAATALGIDRRTLQRKLRGYGIETE